MQDSLDYRNDAKITHLTRQVADLKAQLRDAKNTMGGLRAIVRDQSETIRTVRQALNGVITLDGVGGPLTALVEELCRDHSELEARIEAVLTRSADFIGEPDKDEWWRADEIRCLLRGGKRVPDTIEEITG